MKRKLDEKDAPTVEVQNPTSFESFNLDPRLLQAVRKEKYLTPTPVQAAAIPLALEGKDILGKAKTGSGKTAAYALPILHSILQTPQPVISTLILVPTRELAAQVHQTLTTLSSFCSKDVRSVNITARLPDAVLQATLQGVPNVVISTPGRAIQFVAAGHLKLDAIKQLVVDEADLVLSYGYENDMTTLSNTIPRGVQTILMSATLTDEVETLKTLFCREPVILKLKDEEEDNDVTQYVVRCAEDEKFLLIFVMFKLRLVKGKTIVFVGDVDRSYRLKLYLEQFGIRSCILNSELPINSRLHVVQEFNKGVYDIIIAADDQEIIRGIAAKLSPDEQPVDKPPKSKKAKTQEFGVARGIDFQNVACVLNFDLPQSSKSYIHRIGRTARAGKSGMALSFVIPEEHFGKHKPTSITSAKHDEKVMDKIIERQAKKGKEVKPYNFDMSQVDAFRYRMNDALRAVTRIAVREARAREIKQELLKSDKLKKHFEENPEDLRHLRHDGESRTVRIQSHLKHVPSYLMPAKGRKALSADEIGFVPMRKPEDEKKRRGKAMNRRKGHSGARRSDPLKSFNARRKR